MKDVVLNTDSINVTYAELEIKLELLLYKITNSQKTLKILQTNPQGFYIYGDTGTGKTTLMNSFFQRIQEPKLNIHFHDYFIDITRLLTKYSCAELASKIASKIKVLCFDEFYIESIADAKLMEDLFQKMIKLGIIVIITSNFAPQDLYKGGFNRHLVFPAFSNFLHHCLNVFHLTEKHDFRKNFAQKGAIFTTKIPSSYSGINLNFNNHIITGFAENQNAVFEYSELFKKPRSANEYVFLCRQFDIIYIKNFQPFTKENEDELIRFRNFIDVAYQRHAKIKLEGSFIEEEIFPTLEDIKIKRTYSRLLEMSSEEFYSQIHLQKREWQKQARLFLETL